jgi:hypothetical protein
MRMTRTVVLTTILGASLAGATAAWAEAATAAAVAVGPQYDTTHVYVAPDDFDRFVASLIATFGGTKSQQGGVSGDTDAQPDDVPARVHPRRHDLRVRLQDAGPLSFR